MSATVHSFPPLQSMNSPRGWALAIIVLLHIGFFLLLTSGLSARIMTVLTPQRTQVVDIAPQNLPTPPRRVEPIDVPPLPLQPVFVPIPDNPIFDQAAHDNGPIDGTTAVVPAAEPAGAGSSSGPVIADPAIDPRLPLSEPDYPATEIRLGHAGTVMLSVYVLENGRVGEVRIDQSSGFARLDLAAQREARRWRLKPGTQDGRPTPMWKTIPITFQLKQ